MRHSLLAALYAALTAALWLLLAPAALAADDHMKVPDDAGLAALLESAGYTAVAVYEAGAIRFKAESDTFVLIRYENGDLQLYFGISGIQLEYADANDWNARNRLSKAYLDVDNEPVLEADLLASGGLNEARILSFVRVFVISATQFREFIVKTALTRDAQEEK